MLWLLPLLNSVAVTVALGITAYGMFVSYISTRAKKLMPELAYHEECQPVLGLIMEFVNYCTSGEAFLAHVNKICEYYKDGFQGTLGHQLWIFMPDHQVMQEVMANQDIVQKNFVYQFLNCITDGVFIAPGYRWRKLRKRLNLTFSAKQIECYMETVNYHTEVYLNSVIRKLSQQGKFVDIQPYIARFFFDIMTNTHFGVLIDEQVKNKFQVPEITSKLLEYIAEGRALRPHLHNDFFFQLSNLFKEICALRKEPLEFIDWMIERRQKDVEQHGDISNDPIVYIDQVADVLTEMNIPPTIQNIQRNSSDLLIAGSDTTSVTAAALLYFLAAHKDIQRRVYEEVSQVYGQDHFRPLTRQELASMTYLDMTVNEALRWSAPPGVMKTFLKDFDAVKFTVPKNGNMYLLMGSQHRNPDYYEKVGEFYPEHFTAEAVKSRPKMAFIPFSHGPRNCPGKAFAYVLIKAATAAVINNYYLETDLPMDQVKYKILLMTQHVQGYPIRFIPREILNQRG